MRKESYNNFMDLYELLQANCEDTSLVGGGIYMQWENLVGGHCTANLVFLQTKGLDATANILKGVVTYNEGSDEKLAELLRQKRAETRYNARRPSCNRAAAAFPALVPA